MAGAKLKVRGPEPPQDDVGPHKKSHAGDAQTNARPAYPGRRGKREPSENACAFKQEVHRQRDEQKKEQVLDDQCPQALAPASSAIPPDSLARPPYAKGEPESQQESQEQ